MEYTLREKKHAHTKLAIMRCFMDRLKLDRFDDISVKEVCRKVEVAEGTFFNYFPEKIDVIRYYLLLNVLKIIWKAKKEAPAGSYLGLIEAAFKEVSDEFNNDNVNFQMLSVLLAQSRKPEKIPVSGLEKKLAHPDCLGIQDIPVTILDEWFAECINGAKRQGQLPNKTNVEDTVVSLVTIMVGTILATRFVDSHRRTYHYLRQLKSLWKILGVREEGK